MRQISLQVPPNSPAVFEAQQLVQMIGVALGGSRPGDALAAAWKRLNPSRKQQFFSHSRLERLWYAKSKTIRSTEMDRLRTVAAQVDKERAVSAVVALRRKLADMDESSNREAIAALDRALGHLGHEDRAGE